MQLGTRGLWAASILAAACDGVVLGPADRVDVDGATPPVDGGGERPRDDGGSRPHVDAGPPPDGGTVGEPDGGFVDPDLIPMFVAYGHAARTIVSCDGGETWVAEHAFEADGHDHSTYAGFGRMAHAEGRFVGCAGWGNPTRVVTSDNGVDWTDLPDDAFVLEDGSAERPRAGCAGVTWNGTRFALLAGGRLFTSADGEEWTRHPDAVPGSGHLRRVGGGNGLIVYARDGDAAYVSADGGDSWYAGAGFDADCTRHIQNGGAIVVEGDDVIVADGEGTICASGDRGRTFAVTRLGSNVRSVIWDGTEYVAIGHGDALFRSPDGVRWTAGRHDADADLTAIAHAGGTYVAVARDGERFFVGSDAATWRAARSEGVEDERLWTIVPGFGLPSAACPAP